MARVKPKRHGVSLDMTAMCDVAFLLLTFFILTTQFKSSDSENVEPPSSISEMRLDEGNVMILSITDDGRYFFSPTSNPKERRSLLERMGKFRGITFTPQQVKVFEVIPSFGVPITKLPSFLSLSEEDRKAYHGEGIPQDSTRAELVEWVEANFQENPSKVKLAVKGDVNTLYPHIREVFEAFRDRKIYKFSLITTAETNPEG